MFIGFFCFIMFKIYFFVRGLKKSLFDVLKFVDIVLGLLLMIIVLIFFFFNVNIE